jgi:uncharacterized membrane protein
VSRELILVEWFLFADKALNMFPVSVDYNQEMVSEYVFGCISMMLLQEVIYSPWDMGLAYDIHSHIAPYQMQSSGK